MKLKSINENDDDNEIEDVLDKYVRARQSGNIQKVQSTGNPNKTDFPDRSGNQQSPSTDDEENKDLLGASGNSRDKQSAKNLVGNPSPKI